MSTTGKKLGVVVVVVVTVVVVVVVDDPVMVEVVVEVCVVVEVKVTVEVVDVLVMVVVEVKVTVVEVKVVVEVGVVVGVVEVVGDVVTVVVVVGDVVAEVVGVVKQGSKSLVMATTASTAALLENPLFAHCNSYLPSRVNASITSGSPSDPMIKPSCVRAGDGCEYTSDNNSALTASRSRVCPSPMVRMTKGAA